MDNNTNLMNAEDFGLSFSEEVTEKIQAVFSETVNPDMKPYAANILIGNLPAAKLNEHVGDRFELHGYHVKNTAFSDGRNGKYTTLFGRNPFGKQDELCAYGSASDKVYKAVMAITAVYGTPDKWKDPIFVEITMNTFGQSGSGKAYSLKVIG